MLLINMLLINMCGPASFDAQRAVYSIIFRLACEELNLQENDTFWNMTIIDTFFIEPI